MDVLKIVIGVAGTVLAFYATSSMLLAQKQLLAATRLNGYLTYWQNWMLEHEISNVYALALTWNQEDQEVRKRGGGAAELMALQKERKQQMNLIRQQLEKGDVQGLDTEQLDRIRRVLQHVSKESVYDFMKVTRQNLIDGKTFISDEEATTLGVAFTVKCIELKMGMLDLLDTATNLIIGFLCSADFEIRDNSAQVADLIWKGVSVSRNIDTIARTARTISSQSVLALTWRNIVTGKRLTKR